MLDWQPLDGTGHNGGWERILVCDAKDGDVRVCLIDAFIYNVIGDQVYDDAVQLMRAGGYTHWARIEQPSAPKRDTLVDELKPGPVDTNIEKLFRVERRVNVLEEQLADLKPDDHAQIWEHIRSLEFRVKELESPGFSEPKSEAAAFGQELSNLQKLERRLMLERPPSAFLVVSAIRRYRDAAATLRQRMSRFSNDALLDFAHAVDAIENSKDYE